VNDAYGPDRLDDAELPDTGLTNALPEVVGTAGEDALLGAPGAYGTIVVPFQTK